MSRFLLLCFLALASLSGFKCRPQYVTSQENGRMLGALLENLSQMRLNRSQSIFDLDPELQVLSLTALLRDILDADVANISTAQLSPVGAEFSCPPLEPSSEVPQSVHQLRPSDVKVVAAMGDSITASFLSMAQNLLEAILLREYVGNSWSIGGDYKDPTEAATLPNFLHFYNENLRGRSEGSCGARSSGTDSCSNGNFNVARSGAKAKAMLGQAERLVSLIKADSDVNFEEDWKVVTLWIGANDLCQSCGLFLPSARGATPEEYEEQITQALDYLHEHLPRTFVNLVNIIDVAMLQDVSSDIRCSAFHLFECTCLSWQEHLKDYAQGYQTRLRNLVDSGKYDDREDFTVVLQTFFEKVALPENAIDYFAPDCFHFNSRGQAVAAVSLWNNMLEPVGSKSTDLALDRKAKCPQEPYYLFTKKNSAA